MLHPGTRFAAALIPAIALSGCVEDGATTCSCVQPIESTTFSKLSVPDTLDRIDTLSGTVFLPGGCTEYQHTEIQRRADTIVLDPLFAVNGTDGAPCAHAPGSVDVRIPLDSSTTKGANWVRHPVGRTEVPDSFVTVSVRIAAGNPP